MTEKINALEINIDYGTSNLAAQEIIQKQQQLKAVITELRFENRELAKEQRQYLKEIRKGSDTAQVSYENTTKKIVNNENAIRQLSVVQRGFNKDIKDLNKAKTSIEALDVEYGQILKRLRQMSAAERKVMGKNLIKRATDIRKEVDKFNTSLKNYRANIGNYASGLEGIAGAFGKLGTAFGVSAGFYELNQVIQGTIGTFKDFEFAFDDAVSKLDSLDRTEENIGKLRTRVLELGESTEFTASQVAGSVKFLAQAGLNTNEILQSLESTLNLASSGGIELGEAADIATNILSGFGESASEANKIIDVLAKTSVSANTDIIELGEASKYAAPIFSQLGAGVEEVSAAMGALANNGLKGSVGTRALANSIPRITKGIPSIVKKMKELNLSFFDNGQFVGLNETISRLETAYQGLTQEQQAAATATIFGAEAAKSINALLGFQKTVTLEQGEALGIANERFGENNEIVLKGSEALKIFTKDLQDSEGAAKDIAEAKLDNLQGDILKLQSAVEGAKIALVEARDEGLRKFIQTLTQVLPPLIKNIDLIVKIGVGILIIAKNQLIANKAIAAWNLLQRAGATITAAYSTAIGVLSGKIKLSIIQTKAATVVTRVFNTVVRANPVGALVTVLTSAYLAYQTYARFAGESSEAQRKLNESTQAINREFAREKVELGKLFKLLKDVTISQDNKRKAIDKLQEQYPSYLRNINLETASSAELSKIQKEIEKNLLRNIALKQKDAAITELYVKQADLITERTRLQREGASGLSTLDRVGNSLASLLGSNRKEGESLGEFSVRLKTSSLDKQISDIEKQIKETEELFNDAFDLEEVVIAENNPLDDIINGLNSGKNNNKGGGSSDNNEDSTAESIQKESQAAQNSIEALEQKINELQAKIKQADPSNPLFDKWNKDLVTAQNNLDEAKEKLEAFQNRLKFEADGIDTRGEVVALDTLPAENFLLEQDLEATQKLKDARIAAAFEEVKAISELRQKQREEELQRERELRTKIKGLIIDAYQIIATAQIQIERNTIERNLSNRLSAIEEEKEEKLKQVQGNAQLEAQIEKEYSDKKDKLEAEAAKKRKAIAKKEAIIQGALAVVKALPNPFTVALAVATTLANLAVIDSQQFAKGGSIDKDGFVHGNSHKDGGVKLYIKGSKKGQGKHIEVEGGEWMDNDEAGNLIIINKQSARAHHHELKSMKGKSFLGKAQVLNQINQSKGGVDFSDQIPFQVYPKNAPLKSLKIPSLTAKLMRALPIPTFPKPNWTLARYSNGGFEQLNNALKAAEITGGDVIINLDTNKLTDGFKDALKEMPTPQVDVKKITTAQNEIKVLKNNARGR